MEKNENRKKWGMLIATIIPQIYLGIIAAVGLHETIGHGMLCAMLGGKFLGFTLLVDGMGYALIEFSKLMFERQILIYWGGFVVTTILSVVAFVMAYRLKKRMYSCMFFLVMGYTFMMDGIPYFFWDSLMLGGIGDFSRIFALQNNQVIRWVVIVFTGMFFILSTLWFDLQLTHLLVAFFQKQNKPMTARIGIYLFIGLLQMIGWSSFDFNQLVPGIGLLPMVVGIVLTILLIAVIPIFWAKGKLVDRTITYNVQISIVPPTILWMIMFLVILMIILCFQKGIVFSGLS